MICSICHTTLPDDSRFCLACGADMSDPTAERRPMDTVAEVQDMLSAAVAGHYQVKSLLGRGGMGTVFLAEDLTLQREVAIKVLPPKLTIEEKFVARFMHEARTAAKLDHPNIIPIYAVQSAGSLHYFAMKYVNGRTVDALLDQGPIALDECRRILFEAAVGLGHAHARGVIHRDIKPSNLMLDETGRVLIGDFGISKALESATQFTGTGQYVGTPHYMSPEQAKGVKLDGRSDQYSLAVLGFQMLTGRLPFAADAPHTAMYKHIHETPPRLSSLLPEAPAYLDEALARALSKDPATRFGSMEEFAAAVAPERAPAVLTGEVRSSPSISGSGKRSRRLAVGALAVVAVIAAAVMVPQMLRAPAGGSAAGTAAQPAAPPVPAPPAESTAGPASADPPATGQTAPRPRDQEAPTRPAPTSRTPTGAPTPQPQAAAAAPVPATPQVGYLAVDAAPYGTVSINGVDIGDTPVTRHPLAPGTYTVRVSRDGYRAMSEEITITAGNTVRRRWVLLPEGP